MSRAFRHIIACFAILSLSIFMPDKVVAQVDAQLSHYWATPAYYNPSATGLTDFIHITGASRLQWVGVEHAPTTFLALADMPFKFLGKRFGVGVNISQDTYGLYKNLNVGAQLSYKIPLFKGTLSIGMQVGILNDSFKGTLVEIPDGDDYHQSTDPAIPQTDIAGTALDLAAGLYYSHKHFWVSASVTHANAATVTLKAGDTETELYEFNAGRNFYLSAGGNIPIKNTLFEILPSGFFKTDGNFWQAEATARVRYNKFLSAGLAYRWNDAISIMAGAELKNFFIGYCYDYSTSAIAKASGGSHEVVLQYNVKLNLTDKNKNKHKSIRIM